MTLREAIMRANAALDWIEERDGPLKTGGYARVEATVAEVRAWGQAMSDDERIAEIRDIHVAGVGISAHVCANCYDEWPCDTVYLLARVDALAAERDESVGNMTAIAAAFARLKTRSESWNDDSKRLHNEYMPTVAIIDELLAIKDAAITKAEAERDAALARLEASEAALRDLQGRIDQIGMWADERLAARERRILMASATEMAEIVRAALAAASEGE